MSKEKKNYSSSFLEYMSYIAQHETYKTLPERYKKDGSVKWVVSGNSELGKKRAKWWDNLVSKYNVSNRAEVARLIHPKELNGMKPCQTCGKKLSIHYVYPSKNTLKKINKLGYSFESYDLTIDEIVDKILEKENEENYKNLREIFNIPNSITNNKSKFLKYIKNNPGRTLSPGVMSNAPDRFDGFHSYNACCRSTQDTGRHKDNLSRYSQDRRAYENWAEGNWNLANRLMGEFNKCSKKFICPKCGKNKKMSADHIGPISLGFTHRAKFKPLCNSCNSQKNNRMTLEDIEILLNDEKKGEKIISWHSKYLWDNLKFEIKNDNDALLLSKIMREHIHNVLKVLSNIKKQGYGDFLLNYLHEEYSFYDYTFENFNPLDLDSLIIKEKPLESKNKKKNSERYIRISFESLDAYISKENRKIKNLLKNDEDYEKLFHLIKTENLNKSKEYLNKIIEKISDKEIEKFHKSK